MKKINKFVDEVFKSSGLLFTPNEDINKVCLQIQKNIDDIVDKLDESKGETLSDTANTISSNIQVEDMWKYAAVFDSLQDTWQIELPINENIREKISVFSKTWQDCGTLLEGEIEKRSIDVESSKEEISAMVDYAIGCLFMAIELSIEDGDDDGIDAWIMGFGNPVQYDDPIGDIVMSIDSSVREELLDCYVDSLLSLYQIDTEEYRDSDDAIEWNKVSEAIKGFM